MTGFITHKVSAEKVIGMIEDFEQFCLGKKQYSPQQFMDMNQELSLSAVLSIGRRRIEPREDGNHLIWIAPDQSEHDLGPVEKLNIVRDCPGFHRSRSLSLGQEHVEANELIHVPAADRHISMVRMKDGTVGYGPNYKIALRNAALKMNLQRQFRISNPFNIWKMFYANA